MDMELSLQSRAPSSKRMKTKSPIGHDTRTPPKAKYSLFPPRDPPLIPGQILRTESTTGAHQPHAAAGSFASNWQGLKESKSTPNLKHGGKRQQHGPRISPAPLPIQPATFGRGFKAAEMSLMDLMRKFGNHTPTTPTSPTNTLQSTSMASRATSPSAPSSVSRPSPSRPAVGPTERSPRRQNLSIDQTLSNSTAALSVVSSRPMSEKKSFSYKIQRAFEKLTGKGSRSALKTAGVNSPATEGYLENLTAISRLESQSPTDRCNEDSIANTTRTPPSLVNTDSELESEPQSPQDIGHLFAIQFAAVSEEDITQNLVQVFRDFDQPEERYEPTVLSASSDKLTIRDNPEDTPSTERRLQTPPLPPTADFEDGIYGQPHYISPTNETQGVYPTGPCHRAESSCNDGSGSSDDKICIEDTDSEAEAILDAYSLNPDSWFGFGGPESLVMAKSPRDSPDQYQRTSQDGDAFNHRTTPTSTVPSWGSTIGRPDTPPFQFDDIEPRAILDSFIESLHEGGAMANWNHLQSLYSQDPGPPPTGPLPAIPTKRSCRHPRSAKSSRPTRTRSDSPAGSRKNQQNKRGSCIKLPETPKQRLRSCERQFAQDIIDALDRTTTLPFDATLDLAQLALDSLRAHIANRRGDIAAIQKRRRVLVELKGRLVRKVQEAREADAMWHKEKEGEKKVSQELDGELAFDGQMI